LSSAPPRRRLSAAARRELIEEAATAVFAERGYQGASMDEIAQRSGVSAPVLYDHFASKLDLHRRLLERHFAGLQGVWRDHLPDGGPPTQRIAHAFDAWFAYVQSHPYAGRMLFRETTGDPEVDAVHREVAERSRAAVLPLLAREVGADAAAGSNAAAHADALAMSWEVLRTAMQGLALWWYDHPHVPREQVVATAMNWLWIGLERVSGGERWTAGAAGAAHAGGARPE